MLGGKIRSFQGFQLHEFEKFKCFSIIFLVFFFSDYENISLAHWSKDFLSYNGQEISISVKTFRIQPKKFGIVTD